MRRYGNAHGFTLIELLVGLILLSIFASFAIPSFARLVQNNRVESVSNEFYAFLQLARSEAVDRRTTVTVAASSGVWSVSDGTGTLRQLDLSNGDIAVTPLSGSTLKFQPNGTGIDIDFNVCNGEDFANGYQISVEPSGRIHRSLKRGHDTSVSSSNPQGAPLEACS